MTDTGLRTGVWIIALGVIVTAIYFGRAILSPLAIAVFLWLVMESFARQIRAIAPFLPDWASRLIGILGVLCGFVLLLVLLGHGIEDVSSHAADYESQINNLIAQTFRQFGFVDPPTFAQILFGEAGQKFLGTIAGTTSTLSESLVIVLIYVAFLFIAASNWSEKLDALFPHPDNRKQVQKASQDIVLGIENYVWTQTVISLLISVLTWITLMALGVQNAILLTVLIFVLNYIPTIGSIIAAFLPALFALVQPDWPDYMPENVMINAAIVFLAVSFWQFSIGNFVQPRMMGDKLNLSTLVVLLSLSVWGALWGITGMFLSAPLTVILMVICNQFDSTRSIAILLSSNGKP